MLSVAGNNIINMHAGDPLVQTVLYVSANIQYVSEELFGQVTQLLQRRKHFIIQTHNELFALIQRRPLCKTLDPCSGLMLDAPMQTQTSLWL